MHCSTGNGPFGNFPSNWAGTLKGWCEESVNKEVTKGIKIPTFSCAIIGSGINLLLPSI